MAQGGSIVEARGELAEGLAEICWRGANGLESDM
jgi:hypothetical protein